jgi:hypothetical protein
METVTKRIIILGDNENAREFARSVNHDDVLIIGNVSEEKEESKEGVYENSFYVLKIVVVGNKVAGVIVVDKLLGDITFIQCEYVLFADLQYEKIFLSTKKVSEVFYDQVLLLTDAGIDAENIEFHERTISFQSNVEGILILSDVESLSQSELISIHELERTGKAFVDSIRVLPDFAKLQQLHEQVVTIVENFLQSPEESHEKSLHLLEVIQDGIERQALEVFSDKVNIYDLVWTFEVNGSVEGARLYLECQR